jgi:uncharacterized protein (DUF983 family)
VTKTITTLSGAAAAGLACACPRCGQGRLFAGFLKLQPRCECCGLDYGFADSGDGPAVFIMFLAGAIVVGAALVTEILFQPPYWVHAALWLPLIVLVTLGPLRPMKGLMIVLQYHHKAAESRFGQEQGQEQGREQHREFDREHQEP